MNPDMVAEYTPALGQERARPSTTAVVALHPGQPERRRPGHPDGVCRSAAWHQHGPAVHHRGRYPPEILLTGVIVNKDGRRFVAEDSYHSRTSAFVLEQPEQAPT
jgi:hypothetical protein